MTCFHIFLTTSHRRRGKTKLTSFPWVILLSKQLLISLDNGSLEHNPFSFSAGIKMKVYLNGGDFSHPIIETRKLATSEIHQDTRQKTRVALSLFCGYWLSFWQLGATQANIRIDITSVLRLRRRRGHRFSSICSKNFRVCQFMSVSSRKNFSKEFKLIFPIGSFTT